MSDSSEEQILAVPGVKVQGVGCGGSVFMFQDEAVEVVTPA